jgi:hypothetical protein
MVALFTPLPRHRAEPTAHHALRRTEDRPVAKPHRKVKKANHGARPANAKGRKRRRAHIKT